MGLAHGSRGCRPDAGGSSNCDCKSHTGQRCSQQSPTIYIPICYKTCILTASNSLQTSSSFPPPMHASLASITPSKPHPRRARLPKRQCRPSRNQQQPTQRRDRTQKPKPLRIQRQRVNAPAKQRHAGSETRRSNRVVARDEQSDGVDELYFASVFNPVTRWVG